LHDKSATVPLTGFISDHASHHSLSSDPFYGNVGKFEEKRYRARVETRKLQRRKSELHTFAAVLIQVRISDGEPDRRAKFLRRLRNREYNELGAEKNKHLVPFV